jgi:YjbE family integral membrane protein
VDASLLSTGLEVLLVNIVLSGDNAVVIGLASRGLPSRQRQQAIVLGGVLAVLLRLAFTIPAQTALHLPLLGATGGLLLAWVAYRLLTEESSTDDQSASTVWTAVRLMVIADATMSLDNVLAVAAIAQGTPHPDLVLAFGLVLSIPVVLLGGSLVAAILGRYPWLTWVGAAVLTVTAAGLITGDVLLGRLPALPESARIAFAAMLTGVVLGAAWFHNHRHKSR